MPLRVALPTIVCCLAAASPAAALESDARLRQAVGAAIRAASGSSGAYVYDAAERRQLYTLRDRQRRVLASNVKLFTTAAALDRFEADGTFETDVTADELPDTDGVVRGNLYLLGGGDPTFGAAAVDNLALQVRAFGVRRVSGRVVGDESRFDALRGGPGSGYGLSHWVGPLGALVYDRGRYDGRGGGFQSEPARFAAAKLTAALDRRGVAVAGSARAGSEPSDAEELATVLSPPLSRLVRLTNKDSDNFTAELLVKQLDAGDGRAATTAGGSARAAAFGRRHGAVAQLVDGSGLAHANRASPRSVGRLLLGMRTHPDYASFHDSLPLAGVDGTLRERMRSGPAYARCRAKTGTVSGVSALSGYCRAWSGDPIVFSILMNGVSRVERARRLQDRIAHALVRYG